MSESPITIPVADFSLEGLYQEPSTDCSEGAVICHPHSLYGGNMDNNVVIALQSVLSHAGWGTLRFNFRGVGRSGGGYGEGLGEMEDVRAAAKLLRGKNIRVHLAGYSFGAWVGLHAMQSDLQVSSMILVSPPMDMLDFSKFQLPRLPCLITLGDRDEFCAVESLRNWVAAQTAATQQIEVVILPQCDHFHWGRERLLMAEIEGFIGKYFPAPGGAERNHGPKH